MVVSRVVVNGRRGLAGLSPPSEVASKVESSATARASGPRMECRLAGESRQRTGRVSESRCLIIGHGAAAVKHGSATTGEGLER